MRSLGSSLPTLLLVSAAFTSIHAAQHEKAELISSHADSFLRTVKLTTAEGDTKYCSCSFAMVLKGDVVDVERCQVKCEAGCSGSAADLELEDEGTNFYIVDAFSIFEGIGTITAATVILKPCAHTERCIGAFSETGVKGFCSKDSLHLADRVECVRGDSDGAYCNFTGCSCCKECFESGSCSERGEGWSCYSAEEAALLPAGLCATDNSCSKTPGSPHKGACRCCKKEIITTSTIATPINDTCSVHTNACHDAFYAQGLGVRGFCGEKSLMGGDCSMSDQPGGKHYCQGDDCTCCKECLDVTNKCSARGPGWSCHNKKAALALPEGSCYFDRSCSSAPDSPFKDSSCVCCKPPVNPCEDYGCSKEWGGLGACVNVTEADWGWVDNYFNLSVPAIPNKCGPDCPESYCVCLKKKETCADQGCSSFFGGFGICLNAMDPKFAEMSPSIDFSAGGREDLCAGCCSCFKKRCVDSVHGSVGFAVDTTGSMQKSLPLVKATIINLVETGSEVPHWFLTGFNDPDVNLVKETASPDELKLAADGLTFNGGGDSKEQALQGIDVTLDAMPDNGIILVFTDNGSHKLELENAVKEKSQKKNIKVLFAILTSPGVIDAASLEVYESIAHGEIFYSTEDGSEMVDIKAFFEAVVNVVQHPCHEVVD